MKIQTGYYVKFTYNFDGGFSSLFSLLVTLLFCWSKAAIIVMINTVYNKIIPTSKLCFFFYTYLQNFMV